MFTETVYIITKENNLQNSFEVLTGKSRVDFKNIICLINLIANLFAISTYFM